MKKKNLLVVLIFFCITSTSYYAQQIICANYSFPNYSSAKLVSSNMTINTVIGNTVIGTAKSNTSIIRTKSLLNNGNTKATTGVIENNTIPNSYSLEQNYPNPFNPSTQIKYSIPQESLVKLVIYNLLGAQVAELVNEQKVPGIYTIEWNAKNYSSGVYIYNLRCGSRTFSKKLILLK
jgi:hypothetical protein